MTLLELRRAAIAGDRDAFAELEGRGDEICEQLELAYILRGRGLLADAHLVDLKCRELAGDLEAKREREAIAARRQARIEAERDRLEGLKRSLERKEAAAERREEVRLERARRAVASMAAEAGGVLLAEKAPDKVPEWASVSARRGRPARIVVQGRGLCPPVFIRGASADHVYRWLREASKFGHPTEREAALRLRALLDGASPRERQKRWALACLVHVIFVSALRTKSVPGRYGVTVGVSLGELAARAAHKPGGAALGNETVSRYVSMIRGTDGACRAKRRCARCLEHGRAGCGRVIDGARREGLFSDLVEVHQPPGGLPGVPHSVRKYADGRVEEFGLNLYWLYDAPRQKKTAPGDGRLDQARALALVASNPSASEIANLAASRLDALRGAVSRAGPGTDPAARGAASRVVTPPDRGGDGG